MSAFPHYHRTPAEKPAAATAWQVAMLSTVETYALVDRSPHARFWARFGWVAAGAVAVLVGAGAALAL